MTMHFSYSNTGNGSKATKIMLVAGLHVALGALAIHTLNTRKIPLSILPEQVVVMLEPEPAKPPPPPPEPPKPMKQIAPPELVKPKTEVDVPPPPDPSPLQATEAEPAPHPFTPMQSASDAPPATDASASNNTGQMRTAVLADANGCALPQYPASAARNGETGTTTLALLVGVDGRVSSARIEQSSGSRVLDKAALNALSLCKFKPATNNGTPEAGWGKLAYDWKLD
jgi:protein TonB